MTRLIDRLWFRITLAFSLLTLTLLIFLWFFVANVSENSFEEMTSEHLYENAELVAQLIEASDMENGTEALQSRIELFKEPISMRFTVIDTEGVVLADSESDPETMDNHTDRPEDQDDMNDDRAIGESVRLSETEDTDMMYVSKTIYDDEGSMIGAITTSQQLTSINMTRRLSEKDYSSRVHTEATGEIGELSDSVNELAMNLQNQMRALHENEQQLSTILSNMVSGVMLVNQEGEIIMINSAMERFLEQHNQHIVGQNYTDFDDNLNLGKYIAAVFEDNEKIHEEITSEGLSQNVFDAHLGPFYGNGWKQRGVIIVLHDITNLKRLEKMRSDFVANVSHELKTPVTSVKGFSETLLGGEVNDEATAKSFLEIIYNESERLDRLIRELLHLSRIENKVTPLNLSNVDLVTLIHSITKTLSKSISEKSLELTLPPSTEKVNIEGDSDRLNQILLNLVANSINYTGEGGRIDISMEVTEYDVHIYIS